MIVETIARAHGKQRAASMSCAKVRSRNINTQDIDNTHPMVMGNNHEELIAETKDNDCIHFLSEMLNNQSLISGAEIEDDAMAIDKQSTCDSNDLISESLINQSSIVVAEKENDMTIKESDTATKNTRINNNENESLILGIGTDIAMETQKMQKKKRKENKNKKTN